MLPNTQEPIGPYTVVPVQHETNKEAVGIVLPDGSMWGYEAPQDIIEQVTPTVTRKVHHPGRPCKALTLDNAQRLCHEWIAAEQNQLGEEDRKLAEALAILKDRGIAVPVEAPPPTVAGSAVITPDFHEAGLKPAKASNKHDAKD